MITQPAKLWRINADLDAADRYGTNMSTCNQSVPLAESQIHVIDPTNPGRALNDSIEHRLHIRRRAADDAEHFGGCSLMLQRFAQFCVAFLDLLEEPHVLDGDDRLIGKSFEKRDLLVREWPKFWPTEMDYVNHDIFSHERYGEDSEGKSAHASANVDYVGIFRGDNFDCI